MNLFDQTKTSMQNLGIYRTEFDTTISIYSGLVEQYQKLEKDLKKSKFSIVDENELKPKKSPQIVTMETLRKDILSYSNALGLTPYGFKKLSSQIKETKITKLEEALLNYGT